VRLDPVQAAGAGTLTRSLVAGGLLAVVMCSSCGGRGQTAKTLQRADFGEAWPFSVDQGTVICIPPDTSVVFAVAGRGTYALNGRARKLMQNTNTDWKNVAEIQRDDPAFFEMTDLVATGMPPYKMSVAQIINVGLDLCGE
jgi:hypothetical protein